ncbi:MAG: hypothetical protein ABR574_12040 [Cryomorphaceae bacterium]|nr:hypothetical protein [Flavobacteriales bacterium]
MKNLITDYPAWAIALCPMIGLAYAALLYYRESRLGDLSKALRAALAVLRFATVAILVFFLLGPLIRYYSTEIDQPVVVLATDNSGSLVLGKDSTANRNNIEALRNGLQRNLGDDYELVSYTFGNDVREGADSSFSEPVTNMANLFESLNSRYANRNLGAVVIASDGIYNRGANPRYAVSGVEAPVYTVALGDTSIQKDVLIAEVAANRIAFLGNKFPIEARIKADRAEGEDLTYSVVRNGEVLEDGSLTADSDQFESTVRFLVDAEDSGLQRYTVKVSRVEGEVTYANNAASVFVDVVDSRRKVLILADSPHPDVFALRRAISSSENYEVEVAFQDKFQGDFDDYDLLVLHQIPSVKTNQITQTSINKSTTPVFAIVGAKTLIDRMPTLGLGVQLNTSKASFNDVAAAVNPSFPLFKLDDDLNDFLIDAPPLLIPFGKWQISNSAETVLKQRVGNIATDDPLLIVNEVNEEKNAVLLGEGLWRWRIYNYATSETHADFDGLITGLLQYLAVEEDKRLFRVESPRDLMESERLIVKAELYNQALEPVNDSEVGIEFTDEEGKKYPFTFTRTETAYRLDAGNLPVGTYDYTASTTRNGQDFTDSGSLSIRPFALEGANLTANHRVLFNISESTGGEMVYPAEIESLSEKIKASGSMKPVSYTTEIFTSILQLGWPLFVLLALLSAEWFIRKRSGHY